MGHEAEQAAEAQDAQESPVRAVLFYSPTCPHCEAVITQVLPPLFERFGGRPTVWSISTADRVAPVLHHASNGTLEVLLIDITWAPGARIYRASVDDVRFLRTREGVPRLVVGRGVMVGSREIPERFPGVIQLGLEGGGIDWPVITGLGDALAVVDRQLESETARAGARAARGVGEREAGVATTEEVSEAVRAEPTPDLPSDVEPSQPTSAPEPEVGEPEPRVAEPAADPMATDPEPRASEAAEGSAEAAPATLESVKLGRLSLAEKLGSDPTGHGLAILVLVAMLVSLGVVLPWARSRPPRHSPGVSIPILAVLGAGVAAYLTYVEASGVPAVCGPVGDCNAVQQSEYARLFGWLPVGALGLTAYAAVVGAWILSRRAGDGARRWARVSLFGLAAAGTVFSIYLTILEPFVIGATCAWCLASAAIVTALMWLSARPAWSGWRL